MKLTKNKILSGLMVLCLIACGRGEKDLEATYEDTTTKSTDTINSDEAYPSLDDTSQAKPENWPVISASLAGLGVGRALLLWAPKKIEALRKFFMSIDEKEATKINQKLLELVQAKENYEKIRSSVPAQIDEALKGNYDNVESKKIKSILDDLFQRRAQYERQLTHIRIQLSNLLSGPDSEITPTNLNSIHKDIARAQSSLNQVNDEIAKVFKANTKIFAIFQKWDLAKARLSLAGQSLDLNFHQVFRSLCRKMIRLHSERIKLKLVDARGNRIHADDNSARRSAIRVIGAKAIRKNFNLAKITYVSSGGFVMIGSGYTLYTTIMEADTEGKELALKVTAALEEGQEALSEEEMAEINQEE